MTETVLTQDQIDALNREKAQLVAAHRAREHAGATSPKPVATALPTGIAAVLQDFAEPGKRALSENERATRAQMETFLGDLPRRGRAALAKHSSLRNKHLDRVVGVLAPFGATYQLGRCPGFDAIAAALPSDWVTEKASHASISPSRTALKIIFESAHELQGALMSTLTGSQRSKERPMDAADLGDSLNECQRDLLDHPDARAGGAEEKHAKLALQYYVERAEALIGTIEHRLMQLDMASTELQRLTGQQAPAAVIASPTTPVLIPIERRKRPKPGSSYSDFDPRDGA
jgi:hypothetical protein